MRKNTWEPRDNLDSGDLIKEFKRVRKEKDLSKPGDKHKSEALKW